MRGRLNGGFSLNREEENDRGQETWIYMKKELSGRISESTDLGAVAIAKPKPVSPVWWPDRSPMFLQSVESHWAAAVRTAPQA